MADYEQLVQIRQQAAHQRMLEGLANQARANLADYQSAIAEGDTDKAAWMEAEYLKNTRELAEMTGQAQQQRQQDQLTDVERGLLREFPGIASDPKKWNEALAADYSLRMRGYHPNSAEYDNAMRTALGLAGPDGRDGAEIASPDTALEAVNNSQIARRYGPVSGDEYNMGVAKLIENKKLGLYEPSK
jgi:hypothetical protein